jgi:IclR family mhp operon transcriptional activator
MRRMSIREEDDIQSLRYGIDALRLLNGRESISTADLVTALGISRGTAYRVVNTLHALGYVARASERRGSRYRLSVRVRRLSDGFDGDRWLLHVAQPLMLESTREHGWPLTLSTPAGDRFFVRYTTDHATQRVLRRYRAGFYRSVLLAGSGLLCLAHQQEPMLSSTIRELQRAHDASVPVSRDPAVPLPDDEPALRALLARIRAQGHARYAEAGDRETSLSIPLHLCGHFVGTLALRVMNVAVKDEPSLRAHLQLLRGIGARIEAGLAAADRATVPVSAAPAVPQAAARDARSPKRRSGAPRRC